MDKNQAKQSFANYISFRTTAKEELEDIKQITNSQKQKEKVSSAFEKHSRNFLNAQGLLNSYNLNGEVNMNDFWEYSRIVSELREAKEKNTGNNTNDNEYCCGWCKQNNSGQYWYNEVVEKKEKLKPISKVKGFYSKFCSQECLNSWNQNNQNNNNSEIICHYCNKFFQGQYWYKNNSRESLIHKFCSSECCNTYWNKKTCSGCSNLLIADEICYCANCSTRQEQIRKNLEKNSQYINKDLDNFQKGLNDYVDEQKDNTDKRNISDDNPAVSIREREREREINFNLNNPNYLLKSCN